MNIIRAEHWGMCFGVRDAINMALDQVESGPVTILGDLVHNETVLSQLRRQGIQMESTAARINTPTVMITAHGASDAAVKHLKDQGLHVVEGTCPLVRFAHRMVMQLAAQGCYPVIVGQRQHVEVRGLTGDLSECSVILDEDDVALLPVRPRYGIAAQTTQPVERVKRLTALLRQRFPAAEVRLVDTVCQPTKQRQLAAQKIAKQCDAVIVVGGAQSNNTKELVASCRQWCDRVFHIQSAADLQPAWLEGAATVGLTAGTSTPDGTLVAVEQRLKEIAGRNLESCATAA